LDLDPDDVIVDEGCVLDLGRSVEVITTRASISSAGIRLTVPATGLKKPELCGANATMSAKVAGIPRYRADETSCPCQDSAGFGPGHGYDYVGRVQRARRRVSADGRARPKLASPHHPDRHSAHLGAAGA